MRRSVLVVLLAGLTMPCAPALAATARVDARKGVVVYRAGPNERNDLRIRASMGVWVDDSVPIDAGPGCEAVDRFLVRCDQARRAVVRLGDRSDRARVLTLFDEVILDGGRGDDLLIGGPGPDTLLGGRGADDLRGGRGVDLVLAGSHGLSTDVTADRMRGGGDSDLLMGSAGPNLIHPGAGVDKVYAGRGRDIVFARDDAVEQIHCGGGEDSAVTDGIDYPLACEHHEPYSPPSPVPLELAAGTGSTTASLLLGCRERHPAACSGTVQLELDGNPLSEERPFTFANRHRFVVQLDTSEPITVDRDGLVVWIRAPDRDGGPTDASYPLATMLDGDPFLRPL
jgi:hypothetical protein